MSYWTQSSTWSDALLDVGVLEESALAMAQSTMQNAINESGLSRADLARKMNCNRSFVSRILTGSHNLTIKTMAKTMAACGFEIRFQPVPIEWNWVTPAPPKKELPANAGSIMLAAVVGIILPTSL